MADPRSDTASAAALADAFAFARAWDGSAWGEESVRAEYRAERVAAAFEALLQAVAQRR